MSVFRSGDRVQVRAMTGKVSGAPGPSGLLVELEEDGGYYTAYVPLDAVTLIKPEPVPEIIIKVEGVVTQELVAELDKAFKRYYAQQGKRWAR